MKNKNYLHLTVLGALLVLLMVGAVVSAQAEPEPRFETPEEAAEAWLDIFIKTVHEANFAALGFKSLDEVSASRLGSPFEVQFVGLDQLRDYQPDSPATELVNPAGRVIFPVLVESQVRVLLDVGQTKDGLWAGTKFGGGELIQLLARYRSMEEDFVVWVPALNQYFIAQQPDEKNLLLTPIITDPLLEKFEAGSTYDAREVFALLHEIAVQTNDEPK